MSKKALAGLGLAGLLTVFSGCGSEAQERKGNTPQDETAIETVQSAEAAAPTISRPAQAGDIIMYYSEEDRVNGPEFRMFVSTKHDGRLREVDVDVDTLVPVTLQDGTQALAPSVAFISNFDILNADAMANLSDAQRSLIEQAKSNMTVDRRQVAFMLEHIRVAHGVEYDDVRAGATEAQRYFDLD